MSAPETAELYGLIRELTKEVYNLSLVVTELKTQIAERTGKECASHAKLRERVDALEKEISEARGGWKLFLALPGVGAAIGVLVAWWAKK